MGGTLYRAQEWRLFIDSSKISLKCVLLDSGSGCASLPNGHSTKLSTTSLKRCYRLICVGLKMVSFCLANKAVNDTIHGYKISMCYLPRGTAERVIITG